MRLRPALQATLARLRRPATWGAGLAFGVLWNTARWGIGMPPNHLEEFLTPFAWAFFFLALAPLPWQWTGSDSSGPRLWRGLIQSIPWNAAWALVLILALNPPARTPPSGPGGPSQGHGRGQGQGQGQGRGRAAMEPRAPAPWLGIHPRAIFSAVVYVSFATLTGWILSEKERAEAREGDARRAATQAQARALQSQMNPHVLFNALSGLTELVREDPGAAEEALVNLAGLLRSLLEHGERPTAPLSMERALVEQYLAVEAVRLGRRLQVAWEWDRDLESAELPPLLLQPLVENAIKHGIAPSRGGGEICIRLLARDGRLFLEVSNTGASLVEGTPEGIGVRNLRERLALLGLPGDAFTLGHEGGWTHARIAVPLPEGRT